MRLYRTWGDRGTGDRRDRALVILGLDETREVLIRDVEHQRVLLPVIASASPGRDICNAESETRADGEGSRAGGGLERVCSAARDTLVERCSHGRISEVDTRSSNRDGGVAASELILCSATGDDLLIVRWAAVRDHASPSGGRRG